MPFEVPGGRTRRSATHDELEHLEGLEARLAGYAGVVNATYGALVDLAAEVIEDALWEHVIGVHSPAHWLAWRAGMHLNQAKAIVSIARRRHELPVTVEALRTGELSLEQARLIAIRVPAEFDASAANFARYQTIPQLTRNLRDYCFDADGPRPDDGSEADGDDRGDGGDAPGGRTDPSTNGADAAATGTVRHGDSDEATGDGDEPDGRSGPSDEASERGRASWWWDDRGLGHLHAQLPTDLAMILDAAIQAATTDLFSELRSDLPAGAKVPWVSTADALVHLARTYLTHGQDTHPGTDRYTIYAHLDIAGWGSPRTRAHLGSSLPGHLAHLATCDGSIRPVWERHGLPLSVGRSHRIVPDRTRRLIEHRDQGCVIPGCTVTTNLDVHHIVHWQDGGPTDTANLVCLCRRHHRQHHLGLIGISGDADRPDGLDITDRHGRPVPHGPTPTPPDPGHTPHQAATDLGIRPTTYQHGPGWRTDRSATYLNPDPPPSPPESPPPEAPPPGGEPPEAPPPEAPPVEATPPEAPPPDGGPPTARSRDGSTASERSTSAPHAPPSGGTGTPPGPTGNDSTSLRGAERPIPSLRGAEGPIQGSDPTVERRPTPRDDGGQAVPGRSAA